MRQRQSISGMGLLLAMMIVMVLVFRITGNMGEETPTQQDYIHAVQEKQVASAIIRPNKETPTGELALTMKDGRQWVVYVADVKEEQKFLMDQGVACIMGNVPQESYLLTMIVPVLLSGVVLVVVFMMMNARTTGGGANARMMNFGKSRAKLSRDASKYNFKKVAGLREEKEDLEELVDFLKSPQKYTGVGARIPKGILLVGPPGTGKTLLAKAVAGESGVPFFSISGSDFVEMFVGVGASRVRDLFEQAKKHAPSIIFIDEIDAVGRQRGAGLGGGHDEREQTLNQMLVEMDGFGTNAGVIIIAATNRRDILDPALLRPGRFDRQIAVGYPDIKGREAILRVHTKNKPIAPDVNLRVIASSTVGFTGADLENLTNEAALLAAKKDRKAITMAEIEEATIKVIAGPEKRSHVVTEKDKKLTSYHEAGHAICTYYLPTQDPVHQISIVPRGMAGGYTLSLPGEDKSYVTKREMAENIVTLLGGRMAEELVLEDISTGASNDIERATKVAHNMVMRYGFSEKLGPIVYGHDSNEVFLGRDFSSTPSYSENVAAEIDAEVRGIIDTARERARDILTEHMDQLHKVAQFLFENEKMAANEFEAMMTGQPMPEKPDYSIYSSHAAHDPNQVTAQTEPVSEQPADSAASEQPPAADGDQAVSAAEEPAHQAESELESQNENQTDSER